MRPVDLKLLGLAHLMTHDARMRHQMAMTRRRPHARRNIAHAAKACAAAGIFSRLGRRDARDAERGAARWPQRFMRRRDNLCHARAAAPRKRLRSGKRCCVGKRAVPQAVDNQHLEFAVRVAAHPRVAAQRLAAQRQIDRAVHNRRWILWHARVGLLGPHHDTQCRTAAWRAPDVELVAQPLKRTHAVARTAGRRVTVDKTGVQIEDARAVVDREQFDAVTDRQRRAGFALADNRAHQQFAALRMFELIGRALGHDDRQLAEHRVVEANVIRHFIDATPRKRNRARIADLELPLGHAQPIQNGFHLVTEICVPSPGAERISNSSHSRLAPPRPRPRPLPVV